MHTDNRAAQKKPVNNNNNGNKEKSHDLKVFYDSIDIDLSTLNRNIVKTKHK